MQIKTYLEKYKMIGPEINRLQSEMNCLINEKTDTYNTIKAYAITGMPNNAKDKADPVLSTVERLIDSYDKKIAFYAERINNIINDKAFFDSIWSDLSLLTVEERSIISLRYFNEYTWEKTSLKTSYCEKQCYRIHNKAIEKLQNEANRKMNCL